VQNEVVTAATLAVSHLAGLQKASEVHRLAALLMPTCEKHIM